MKIKLLLFGLLILISPTISLAARECPHRDQIACDFGPGVAEQCVYGTACPSGSTPVTTTYPASAQDVTPDRNGATLSTEPTDSDEDNADNDPTQRGLINPLRVDSLRGLTLLLFDIIKTLLEIVLVAGIVWSGFLFIKAQGNSDELTKARKTLMYTIIGGIMVLGINVIYEILVATIEQL